LSFAGTDITWALPEKTNRNTGVGANSSVGSDQLSLLRNGLGYEDSIEGISVERGKGKKPFSVLKGDR
jgi:hypothetical protein